MIVRSLIRKLHSIGQQKFIDKRAMIGERPHHRPIVVALIGPTVGLDDGPISEIGEDRVRRVRYTVLFLCAGAAAESHMTAAYYCVSTDIVIGFNHDNRCAAFDSLDGGGKPAAKSQLVPLLVGCVTRSSLIFLAALNSP
jgi:hypothetical protein